MLNVLTHARILVLVAAIAVLAGCASLTTARVPATPATFYPAVSATTSAYEPAWGRGWVGAVEDLQPVLRPDAAANEHLADRMAAAAPYHWTGVQAGCLNRLWTKISDWDNFYRNDLDNGIAGLAGYVIDPSSPANPSVRDLQASGWFAAEPVIQIAAGLVDITVFWGRPCNEWAAAAPASWSPGNYPLGPGDHQQGGTLDFDVVAGRLALTPETLQDLCGVPGEPAAFPPPACARITQATTWPVSLWPAIPAPAPGKDAPALPGRSCSRESRSARR